MSITKTGAAAAAGAGAVAVAVALFLVGGRCNAPGRPPEGCQYAQWAPTGLSPIRVAGASLACQEAMQ